MGGARGRKESGGMGGAVNKIGRREGSCGRIGE